jgi:hypothetical protein
MGDFTWSGAGREARFCSCAVAVEKFVEYRMGEPQDAPIKAGAEGSIWFTAWRMRATKPLGSPT